MEGIVIELQRKAVDEQSSIETLMRTAYIVAKKLKLTEFEEWIEQEQNGYTKEVPKYRNIVGEIKAWNPYRGWITMLMPKNVSNLTSKMPVANSISSLLDVYNTDNKVVAFSINAEITEFFNGNTNFIPTKYAFFASKSELYRIISTVRNKILEWALLLEEKGIVGVGMTFTDIEKKTAADSSMINNYINNFYGQVTDIDINQG